jgi:hypothetical protein
VGVFELNGSGDVVAFSQIHLTSGDINSTTPAQTATPTITTPIYSTDTIVSGKSEDNAHISLTVNGGTAHTVTASATGAWSVTGLTLAEGDTISVTAILSPDTLSNSATATVEAVPVLTAYTVTYDGNGNDGGSVPTSSHTYAQGATVTVLGNTGGLTKTDCAFTGWNTAANGTGTPYAAGNVFSITSNAVTLFAQWEVNNVVNKSFLPPEISPVSGSFTGSQMVTISDQNPSSISVNDAVYYTLDNTMPTLQSARCAELPFTFTLDQSAEVSAAVYNPAYGWSLPASETYTLIIPTTVPYQAINTSVSAPPTTIIFSNSSGSSNTVNLSTLLTAPSSNTTVPLPPLVIQSGTTIANSVVVSIYAGTTISASSGSNWSGSINAPTDQSTSSVTVVPDQGDTASVDSVIEIGAESTLLTFNQPVRLLFLGQTGKLVGYYQNGTFTKIAYQMSADSAEALGSNPDGYYDNGTDLVVWTTHFTQYVIYTEAPQTASSVNNTGGGGGGNQAVLLSISTGSLPTATVDVPYIEIITTNNYGTAPYAFSLASGSLPAGLTLDPGTGTISGTPTAAGLCNFSITVKDATGTKASRAYTLTVNAATENQPATLSDIVGNWAQGSIEKLVSLGYIAGYPDGTFRPDSQITRAEFCAIMDKALNLTTYAQQTPTFTDVNTTDWFDQVVETAVYAGIAKGYGDGAFHPNAPISRQEIACVLVQALGKSQAAESNAQAVTKFLDDHDVAWWSRGYIFVALQQNIVSGYPDGNFKPQDNATRAEACAMIENFLNVSK